MNPSSKRESFIRKTREAVHEALQSRDMLIANVQRSIDELTGVKNALGERLEEWYAVYFPELKLDDKAKFAQFVSVFDKKGDRQPIEKIVGVKKASELMELVSKSLGADINDNDLEKCKSLAKEIVNLDNLISEYEKYQEELCQEICPNISTVAGAAIAAKLISHVGSLSKLSLLPASTIQVLGAEKALFKHLKNKRIDPPKHGIIFQHVYISSSPKVVRGKIARALANKITLAAKADAFTKRFIAEDLKKDLEKRYNEVMEQYKKNKAVERPADRGAEE
ncbi:hypothetical protein J4450_07540 [Candidatus Micrarchaeota archaeon]|nr:hypothetical protein [Candidatus Micrarchaeota archaeon]